MKKGSDVKRQLESQETRTLALTAGGRGQVIESGELLFSSEHWGLGQGTSQALSSSTRAETILIFAHCCIPSI